LGLTEDGDERLLPLVPGAERVVSARVDDVYAEQLLLRAAACGAHVSVVTDRPRRWAEVAGARIAIVAPDGQLPSGSEQLHVYDQRRPVDKNDKPPRPPAGGTAAACLGLIELGGPEPKGNITLDQIGEMVTVTVGEDSEQIKAVVDASEVPHLPSARARIAAASSAGVPQ
jgi:hypothetical protein